MKRSYDEIERDFKEACQRTNTAERAAAAEQSKLTALEQELYATDEYKKEQALHELLGPGLFCELFADKDALLPYAPTSVEKIERIAQRLKEWRDLYAQKAAAEVYTRRVVSVEHETVHDPMEGTLGYTYVKYDDGTREKI